MRALNFASLDARCYAPRRSTGEWRAAGKDWSLTLFENQGTLQQSNQPDVSGEYAVNAQDDNSVNIALGGQLNAPLRLKRQNCHQHAGSIKVCRSFTCRISQYLYTDTSFGESGRD